MIWNPFARRESFPPGNEKAACAGKTGPMIKNTLPQTELKTKDFFYELPQELIAQTPIEPRDSSRLLTVNRQSGALSHGIFRDILDALHPGDVLVINDSRVIPARIWGVKDPSGARLEVVLLRCRSLDTWEVLTKPGRKATVGTRFVFGDGILRGEVTDVLEDGNRLMHFTYDGPDLMSVLDKIGQMPLPPYITEKLADKERYQTVYARESGSAAAPTAGLHFTNELLQAIEAKGVKIARVMLHVGLGTFRPVKAEQITDHVMHAEYISVTPEAAQTINTRTGRLICVGTTSCRTIESCADENGIVHPICDDTSIFIYPGYRFKAVQGLITNFHLPESTLLMLVSAFSSREIMMNAYRTAVKEKYRFFSFGDAMLIV